MRLGIGKLFIAVAVSLAVGFMGSMVYADGDNTTLASGSDVSSESFTVNQDVYFMGDVGIGNTSPGYDLDVAGSINFTGNLYQNGSLFSDGGGNGSGGCYVSYSGSCLSGFTSQGSAGSWGYCDYFYSDGEIVGHFRVPVENFLQKRPCLIGLSARCLRT